MHLVSIAANGARARQQHNVPRHHHVLPIVGIRQRVERAPRLLRLLYAKLKRILPVHGSIRRLHVEHGFRQRRIGSGEGHRACRRDVVVDTPGTVGGILRLGNTLRGGARGLGLIRVRRRARAVHVLCLGL